jgi:hypothetical protein
LSKTDYDSELEFYTYDDLTEDATGVNNFEAE